MEPLDSERTGGATGAEGGGGFFRFFCGGREADGEITPFAVEVLEDLARGLTDRVRRDRVLRQRRREPGHVAGTAVSGTTTLDPDSVIVQRASIVPGAGNSSSGRTRR